MRCTRAFRYEEEQTEARTESRTYGRDFEEAGIKGLGELLPHECGHLALALEIQLACGQEKKFSEER